MEKVYWHYSSQIPSAFITIYIRRYASIPSEWLAFFLSNTYLAPTKDCQVQIVAFAGSLKIVTYNNNYNNY